MMKLSPRSGALAKVFRASSTKQVKLLQRCVLPTRQIDEADWHNQPVRAEKRWRDVLKMLVVDA